MKGFKRTFFVILTVTMSIQSFRHCYLRFFADTTSIIDKYDEAEVKIREKNSLEELEELYKNELANEDSEHLYDYKHAIVEAEGIRNSIRELWFYWLIGIVSLAAGVFIHEKYSQWIGATFALVGFTEMAFWTSPLSGLLSSYLGFEELLSTNLLLSAFSTILVCSIWFIEERRMRRAYQIGAVGV